MQRYVKIKNGQQLHKIKAFEDNKKVKDLFIFRVFIVDSTEELEQIVKYIEDKLYNKHKLVRGDLAFNFLKSRFTEC